MTTIMKKYDVHVCIVSDQPTPNLMPILDKNFRPQEVVLLVSERMKEKAKSLERVLKSNGLHKVHCVDLPDSYRMDTVEAKVLELLGDYDKSDIALNVTGGNKLMAIAAYQTFHSLDYPVFYVTVDGSGSEILLLDDIQNGDYTKLTAQPTKLKLEEYLEVHGFKISDQPKDAEFDFPDLTNELINHAQYAEVLGELYFAVSNQKPKDSLVMKTPESRHIYQMSRMLDLFEEHKLIQINKQKNTLTFVDKRAKNYIMGGWFEEHVYQVVRQLPDIQGVAINLKITNAREHVHQPNEIDIAVMKDNVLHVIECKTVNYKSDANKGKAQDALYKLETLKKLGGLRTQAALVSYLDLPSQARDRAKGSGIKIIEKQDLPGLKKHLANWMSQ
ncbi:hypothetical protein AGMMS49545_00130 [Betaproteobacteria bacterium]|nr:hypothetical protein AGMMS49545_00130 [Betaproteobacteria bacterium]